MSVKGEIYDVMIRKGPRNVGMGLEISMQKSGAITVKGVSGLAYRTGVIAIGDELVQISDSPVAGMEFNEVLNLVRAIKPLDSCPFKFKRGDKIPPGYQKRTKEEAKTLTTANDKNFYEEVTNVVKSMCISPNYVEILSVKELRMKAKAMNVDTRSCTEKSDMLNAINSAGVAPTTYDVHFEVKESHGISLEKVNEWGIIKKGPASMKVGSALVGINGISVALLPYSDTTALLRSASYPLVLTLVSAPAKTGYLLKRSKDGWKRRYFVLQGGWLRYYEDENADLEKDMKGELELQNEEDPETNKVALTTVTMAPSAMLDTEGEPAIMIAKGDDRLIVKGQTSEALKSWAATMLYATGVANGGSPFMKEMETRHLTKRGKLGEAVEKLQKLRLEEQEKAKAEAERLAEEAKLEKERVEEERLRALAEAEKATKLAENAKKEAEAEKDAAAQMTEQLSEAQQQLEELKMAKEKAERELNEAKERADSIKAETEKQIKDALEQAEIARKKAQEIADIEAEKEKEREKQAEKARLEAEMAKDAEDQAIVDAMESFEKGTEDADVEVFARNGRFRGDKDWIGARDDSEFVYTNF